MKRLGIMIGALALVLGMSQCRKPVETINAAPTGETVDVTVSVTSGAGKTEITPTGVVTWKAGDRLYVVGATDGLLGCVSATAAGDPVNFTGSIKALTEAQTLKFYYVGDSEFTLDGSGNYTFSIENQDGSLAGIAANNQLMFGKTAGAVSVGATDLGTISMTSVTSIAHFNIRDDGGNAVSGPVTVTGGFASSTFNAKTYAGETLTGTAGDMTMTFAAGTTSTDCHMALLPGSQTLTFTTSDGKTKTLAAKTIAANTFYNAGSAIEVTVTRPTSIGTFTVSSGVTVSFSPGNLQYLGQAEEGHKWRFAVHQWDYMGDGPNTTTGKNGNVNLGADYEGKYNTGSEKPGGSETDKDMESARDLFGWGCTGYQDTRDNASTYQTNFQPYSTSRTEATSGTPEYGINRYGYGPDYDETNEYGLTVAAKSDWGCLAIGGDPAGTWRMLSSAEWEWLLGPKNSPNPGTNCRTSSPINGTANARYAEVKVNGVSGVMVFPDEFAWPSGVSSLPSTFNTYSSNWNGVDYTTADFGKLESLGVVFLPAAGSRSGGYLNNVNYNVHYWSSTCTTAHMCNELYFTYNQAYSKTGTFRMYGRAVRLVRQK